MNEQIIPRHVAIIPDGNRRWARERGLSTYDGHKKGVDIFREIIRHAANRGVYSVSVWGMSIDNFSKRSPMEIRDLLRIFHDHFVELLTDEEVHSKNIRIRVFGRWKEKFPSKVRKAIEAVETATRHYTKYTCNFLLAYNGTDEMTQAIQQICDLARDDKKLKITPDIIKNHLFTKDLPSVDLVIRTGGEPHLSAGFMMWDIADAELHFTEDYWPAFTTDHFDRALDQYAQRERRFGK